MAIWAVGDVQGSAQELDDLLLTLDFSPSRDELWLVGDLVNRGDDSLRVLKRVEALGSSARVVLGNHDLHTLAVGFGVASLKASDTVQDILNDSRREHWLRWLIDQSLVIENEQWIMVHAGIPPEWDLPRIRTENQFILDRLRADPVEFFRQMYGDEPKRWSDALSADERCRYGVNAFTRMRYVHHNGDILSTPKGPPTDAPADRVPWFNAKRQTLGKKVVFGHWSALGYYRNEQVLCLDTGCAWGKFLTAQRLDQDEPPRQVPCRSAGKSFS